MSLLKSYRPFFQWLTATMACLLTACASPETPALDATFGNAVRAARQAQTLNPGPPEQSDPTQGLDAKAAVNLIERYQDSYKTPPKTFEVLNLGGTVSGQ
jgi:hypothetical protein